MPVQSVATEAEYLQLMQTTPGLIVVDHYATWCGPCKVIAPIFEQLSNKYTAVKFLKVDVDKLQSVAKMNGVTAMPTFGFFVGGKKVGEVRGADPKQLEASILKFSAGSAGGSGTSANGSVFGIEGGFSNITSNVDKQQLDCLNYKAPFALNKLVEVEQAANNRPVLESDCDEQLLISIQFRQPVRLHSIKFTAPASNGPKRIKLFTNRPNLGFQDAESLEATQELHLTSADFDPKKATALRFVKFQNIHSLSIFIIDNQNDSECTAISGLQFIGSIVDTTGDLKEMKKAAMEDQH